MATITTRVDDKVKVALYSVADEIGIPVSSLFNARAKELIRKKKISFELNDESLEDKLFDKIVQNTNLDDTIDTDDFLVTLKKKSHENSDQQLLRQGRKVIV